MRGGRCGDDGLLEGFAGVERDNATQLRLDFGCGRADGVDGAHSFPQQRRELRVVGVFIFAAEDEMDAGGEGGDGLGRGIYVGGPWSR